MSREPSTSRIGEGWGIKIRITITIKIRIRITIKGYPSSELPCAPTHPTREYGVEPGERLCYTFHNLTYGNDGVETEALAKPPICAGSSTGNTSRFYIVRTD